MDQNELKGKVLLVTGAGGFTGRHACEHFAKLGMIVIGVVRSSNGKTPDLNGVQYVPCDLTQKTDIKKLVEQIVPQYVLHLAGRNSVPESWRDPLLYMESNVLATMYLLHALQAVPMCRTVIVGSLLAMKAGDSIYSPHPYSLSKTMEEIAALSWKEMFGQSVIVAQPSNLMGPGPSTGFCSLLGRHIAKAEQGQAGTPFQLSSKEASRDFLDVRDAVCAYEFLLLKGVSGEVYPICSGLTTSLGEITERMQEHALCSVAVEIGEAAASSQSLPQPSKLYQLGWRPCIPLQQSLKDILQYCRMEGRYEQ